MLNHKEIKQDPQMIIKNRSFIYKYNCKGINSPSEKPNLKKKLRKRIEQLLSVFCMLKKKKYILFMFQNIPQIMNKKLFFNNS